MHVKYLTLKKLLTLSTKHGCNKLIDQLCELPCPDKIRIGLRYYHVPKSIEEFTESICWGQRLFMSSEQSTELEALLYLLACYYQPQITKSQFDEKKVIKVFKRLLSSNAIELFPAVNRLSFLFAKAVQNETDKLNGTVTREMRAAEIDRLKPFAELSILQTISDKCKVPLMEAHLVEYNVVFAILWAEKETADFNKRYQELSIASHGK